MGPEAGFFTRLGLPRHGLAINAVHRLRVATLRKLLVTEPQHTPARLQGVHAEDLLSATPRGAAPLAVDTQLGTVVLSVRGTFDAKAAELLEEAIVASGEACESRCVIVDLSEAGTITAEGRRALVACVQRAAKARIGLRFRFGQHEAAHP